MEGGLRPHFDFSLRYFVQDLSYVILMVVDSPLSDPSVILLGSSVLKILSMSDRYCCFHLVFGYGIIGSILILTSKPASDRVLAALILFVGVAAPFSHFLATWFVFMLKLVTTWLWFFSLSSSSTLSDLLRSRILCFERFIFWSSKRGISVFVMEYSVFSYIRESQSSPVFNSSGSFRDMLRKAVKCLLTFFNSFIIGFFFVGNSLKVPWR